MARGSQEHCKSVADLIPGIAYKGDKKFKEARVGLMLAADWDNRLGQFLMGGCRMMSLDLDDVRKLAEEYRGLLSRVRVGAPMAMETLAAEVEQLRDALEESVKLQSHYAKLLNVHDGGERKTFADAASWLHRLREARQEKAKAAE